MSDISKIKWSSEEYTLENFVDLFPLPHVVRIKTNLKGNDGRKRQPGKMLASDVFVLHSVRHKEVIRATDSKKNEFYLPHDSTAKVEVIWKDYKKYYDNVGELFDHFPAYVLVVEDDETLGIIKGDVLKLKRKIKIRENNYLKCVFLDANRADVDIPFNYKGLFKTLGDLTSENIPLREAVEFCKLPRKVKFIDDKLKFKRTDGASKCPTLLSSLEHVTLHEVINHIDVIASQSSEGHVVVSSTPLVGDVIVSAPTAESRSDPNYTRLCQTIDKETTAELVEEIGILHEHWVVFQEDGTKGSSSWNQQLFSLASLGYQDIPHVNDDASSIPVDKDAPELPRKSQPKKPKPPPVPPRIPLRPHSVQGPRKGEDAGSSPSPPIPKARTLPKILTPSQSPPSINDEQSYPRIEPNKKPQASNQDVIRRTNQRFEPDNLEGKDGYVMMTPPVSHLQTRYDLICESIHGQAQPEYSNCTGCEESQHELQPHKLKAPGRERSKSDIMPETSLKVKKDHTRLQKRRSFDPHNPSRTEGRTFPRRNSDQSESGSPNETRVPSDSSQERYGSEDAGHPNPNRGAYSYVPPLMTGDRCNQPPMIKHPPKLPKAPPGLDFINSKNVTSWSPHEVLKFLKFINLEKYTKVFKKKNIDGERLANMDNKGLHELGITTPQAGTIMRLVHECIKHENSTIPNQYVP